MQRDNTPKITRRRALEMFGGLAAGVAALSACSSGGTTTTTSGGQGGGSTSSPAGSGTVGATGGAASSTARSATGGSRTQDASSSPTTSVSGKRGGTLTIGQLTTQIDLRRIPNPSAPVYQVIAPTVFDTILTLDQNLQTQPGLAESFDISGDQRTIKLNLRQGVEFHSGRPLTSADVKWSLTKWLMDPIQGEPKYQAAVKALKSFSTPDDYTIILESEQPNPAMVRTLQMTPISYSDWFSGPDAQKKMIGTGPFVMTSFTPNQQFQFQRNPNYWNSGAPLLDAITITLMSDVQTIGVALRTGQILISGNLTGTDLDSLPSSGFKVYKQQKNSGYLYFAANVHNKSLSNPQLLQAMNYSIDRDSIAKVTKSGTPAFVPWTPGSPIWKPEWATQYTFDPDKAKSLLKASGWDTSQTLQLPVNTNPINDQAAEVVRSSLSTIGITAAVQQLQTQEYNTKYGNNDHDLLCSGMSADFNPQVAFSQSTLLQPGNAQTNFSTDQYQKLYQQVLVEPNANTAIEIGQQLTEIMLQEPAFAVVMAEPTAFAVNTKVKNFQVDAYSSAVPVAQISLE